MLRIKSLFLPSRSAARLLPSAWSKRKAWSIARALRLLPGPPDGVIGVTSVRGKMTVVMDLSLKANHKDEKRRLVLLKGDAQLGLLADHIDGVVVIKPDEVQLGPTAQGGRRDQLNRG